MSNGASKAFNSTKEESLMEILEHTEGGAMTLIDFVGSELSVGFGTNLFSQGRQIHYCGSLWRRIKNAITLDPDHGKNHSRLICWKPRRYARVDGASSCKQN